MIRWGKSRRTWGARRSGAARIPYIGTALYMDFTTPLYASAGVPAANLAAIPGYAYTRAGAKQELLASAGGVSASFAANVPGITTAGYYSRAAATNQLLNAGQSTGLITQNVTVTAQAYTLYFMDIGTVTLTGVSSAGPLVGTGVNNQVSLTFTPTAGTLTLTVSGNVAYACLVAGSLVGPIIATAGTTAAVAEDLLSVTPPALTDTDELFYARIRFNTDAAGANRMAILWGDLTAAGIGLRLGGAGYQTNVCVGTVTVYSASAGPFTSDGNVLTVVLRRLSGSWRGGYIRAGVLTWGSADTAAATPTGVLTASVANYVGGSNPLTNPLEKAVHKLGTFSSDAAVLVAAV